jgi:hypothetical protein
MPVQPSTFAPLSSREEPRRWRKRILIAVVGVFAVVALQTVAFLPGIVSGLCWNLFGIPFYLVYLPFAGLAICFVALYLRLRFGLLFLAASFLSASYQKAETYELIWSSAVSRITVYFREVIARYADIVTGAACDIPFGPLQLWAAEAYGYGVTSVGLVACAAYQFCARRRA